MNSRLFGRSLAQAGICLVVLMLTGCTAQMVRSKGLDLMAAGQYEEALEVLTEGVKDYPDSAGLRAAAALSG